MKSLLTTYGGNNQYALGINVPVQFCNENADLKNFLPNDNAQQVKNEMNGRDRIYKGDQLIGAKPKKIGATTNNYHTEYLLLIKSMSERLSKFDPLMQTLLNSNPAGCTIFFTLNSPCVKTCSTPNGRYSIIPALKMFKNRGGPKAFVFKDLWDEGDNRWENNIKEIEASIPVYRCVANQCTRCVNGNQVNQRCLRNN
ncbi:hypothetical protein C0J45_10762 [Silurus meridionalis]|nr:hypothetical protein C0J45_10762 [Silurus meridionalis]